MKKYSLFVLLSLVNFISTFLNADGQLRYYFDPSNGIFTNLNGKIFSIDTNYFLLPTEVVSNKTNVSLVKVGPQRWFGLSSHTIRKLAENQGKIGFLMGFKNNAGGDNLRIICHFEQWPGLSNIPSSFSHAVKGVMFFPFIPKEPAVEFISLQTQGKVPYLYSEIWEKLPKYFNVALPCYVLWKGKRLVFAMSPLGPFFTINLEGKEAVFQRKFTKISDDGKLSYTTGPIGVNKSHKLSAFNVTVYKDQ